MSFGPLFADLLKGTATTLTVSVAGIAIGMFVGLGLALIRYGRVPVARQAAAVYVSAMRATPMVTLALLIFFGLPTLGLGLPPLVAAILTIAINTSSFQAEIWRAGLVDFPAG